MQLNPPSTSSTSGLTALLYTSSCVLSAPYVWSNVYVFVFASLLLACACSAPDCELLATRRPLVSTRTSLQL